MPVVRACGGAALVLGALLLRPQPMSTQDAPSGQERAKIEAGENVYNNYCLVCHGDRLVGSGQVFDLRRLTAGERARFDNSVRNGKNLMPPWKGVLTEGEIDQIWRYVRANAYQK